MITKTKKSWSGILLYALVIIGVLIYSGCASDNCYKKNGNTRKTLAMETPAFPSTAPGGCAIPENPAGLMFIHNDNIGDVFDQCHGVNDSGSQAHRFKMDLEISGKCANHETYTEVFSADSGTMACGGHGRDMPVVSSNVGGNLVLCPDPHRPDNYGFSDYNAVLSLESKEYSSSGTGAGSCSVCTSGKYTVVFRTDMLFEMVGQNEVSSCSSPFAMVGPFSTFAMCTFN